MAAEDSMMYQVPSEWQASLQAIAQASGQSVENVIDQAIALYLSRQTVAPPSMSAGLTYEDIESEPDEVLWDFLDAPKPMPQGGASADLDDIEDEPDEILPGFL
jgi:predicted transcriptional regulator